MERQSGRSQSVLRSLDWWTIGIYLALLAFGWISVCGASYTYGDTDIFSLDTRSGMQIIWIGTSIVLGFVILMLDDRFYDTFSYVIFGLLLIVLFATIFNPHQIKGSRSWLVLGPLRMQPAEFAKFATALALSKLMSAYGFDIHKWKHFAAAASVVFLPMLLIIGQKETGSALVYLSFFLVFYREGMSGGFLFTAIAMIVYFVVGVKYEQYHLWDATTSVGKCVVLYLIQVFTIGMTSVYTQNFLAHCLPVDKIILCASTPLLVQRFVRDKFLVVVLRGGLHTQQRAPTPPTRKSQRAIGTGRRPSGRWL